MNLKFDYWWLAVAGFLAYLYYNARLIKKERDVYLTEGINYHLSGYSIWLPNWWTPRKLTLLQNISAENLEFYRSDTHYDWLGQFHLVNLVLENSLEDKAKNILTELNIELDPEVSHQTPTFEFLKPLDCFRLEGCGTRNGEDRIYLDLCLILLDDQKIIVGLSLSSILNGCVEGPYFEEALKRIKKNS